MYVKNNTAMHALAKRYGELLEEQYKAEAELLKQRARSQQEMILLLNEVWREGYDARRYGQPRIEHDKKHDEFVENLDNDPSVWR